MSTLPPIPKRSNTLLLAVGSVYSGSISAGSNILSGIPVVASDVGNTVTIIGAGANVEAAAGIVPGVGSLFKSKIVAVVGSTYQLADSAVTSTPAGIGDNVVIYRAIPTNTEAPINYNSSATARDTMSFLFISENDSRYLTVGSPVWMYDLDAGHDIFGGTIDSSAVLKQPGSPLLQSTCDCVSWDYLLTKRFATPYRGAYTNMTLQAIVVSLIYHECGSEGIVVNSVVGPTLTLDPFDFNTVYDALDQICQAASGPVGSPPVQHTYLWNISPWKIINVFDQTVTYAPWTIDDRDGSNHNALNREGEGITITYTREKLSNRSYQQGSRTLQPDIINDAIQGDGSGRSFTTKANIETTPTIDVDGNVKSVAILGLGSAQWYWTPGSNGFSQDPKEPIVPTGHWIHLSYQTSTKTIAFAPNVPGINAAAHMESGTGFWDRSDKIDTLITPHNLEQLAQDTADIYGMVPQAVDVLTYRPGLAVGQVLSIHLSDTYINGQFLIDSVSLACDDNINLWTIHAVNGALIGDYRTAFILLTGGAVIAAGGMLPTEALPAGSVPTVYISDDSTLGAIAQTVVITCSIKNITVKLPKMGPPVGWVGLDIILIKYDSTSYVVIWQTDNAGETVNGNTSGYLTAPMQTITIRSVSSTVGIITNQGTATGVAPPPGDHPHAPTVVAATAVINYGLAGNGAATFGVSGTITMPVADVNYPHLRAIQIKAYGPDGSAAELLLTTVSYPFVVGGGNVVNWQTNPSGFTQAPVDHTYRVEFRTVNEDNFVTTPAYGSNPGDATYSTLVHGSQVSSVSAVESASTNWTMEPNTRLVYTRIDFTPVMFAGIYPAVINYWLSLDNGSTAVWIGYDKTNNSAGKTFFISRPKPGTAQTWRVLCCSSASTMGGDAGNFISVGTLTAAFPQIVLSPPIAVGALVLPSATDIAAMPISTPRNTGPVTGPNGGAGTNWPYNVHDGTGDYWQIDSITIDDTNAVGDINAFFIRVTAQDLGVGGVVVRPEEPFNGFQVGAVVSAVARQLGPLNGKYGTYPNRSGNVEKIRLRVYACNRVDGTAASYANPACATFQTLVGNLDILVAAGGTTPPAQLNAHLIDSATMGPGISQDPVTGNIIVTATPGPNVLGTSTAAVYYDGANGEFGFQGRADLPTSDPNYATLFKRLDIVAVDPNNQGQYLVQSFTGGSIPPGPGAASITYKGNVAAIPAIDQTWSMLFRVYNDKGEPNPSPSSVSGLLVRAVAITLLATEIGPRYTSQDSGLHTVVQVAVTLTFGQYPSPISFWINQNDGRGDVWNGQATISTVGQIVRFGDPQATAGTQTPGTIFTPSPGKGLWKITAAFGVTGNVPPPAGAPFTQFSVTEVAACLPSDVSSAVFNPQPVSGDPIVYTPVGAGHNLWDYWQLQIQQPSLTQDPNYNYTFLTIQKGHEVTGTGSVTGAGNLLNRTSGATPFDSTMVGQDVHISGTLAVITAVNSPNQVSLSTAVSLGSNQPYSVWVPAPDSEGVDENAPYMLYRGRWVTDSNHVGNPTPAGSIVLFNGPQLYGTTPVNNNPDGTPYLNRTFRFRLYCVSHANDNVAGGSVPFTLQNAAWTAAAADGSHDHHDLTPLVNPPNIDLTLAAGYSIGAPLTGGGGQPITIPPYNPVTLAGGIPAGYLGPASVQAINMAQSSITTANKALAAQVVADGNVSDVSVAKFTAGTCVFTGDVFLSRGTNNPIMALQNTGINLYGVANATDGKTGLTSKPWVGIASNQIGVFGGESSPGVAGGSVTVVSTSVNIWTKNGDTTAPYTSVSAAGVIIHDGTSTSGIAGANVQVSSTGVLILGQMTSPGQTQVPSVNISSTGITITSVNSIVTVGSSNITIDAGNGNKATLSSSGITIASGSNQVNIGATVVSLTNGANTVQVSATQVYLAGPGAGTVTIDAANGITLTGSLGITVQQSGTAYVGISSAGVRIVGPIGEVRIGGIGTTAEVYAIGEIYATKGYSTNVGGLHTMGVTQTITIGAIVITVTGGIITKVTGAGIV
jgi:hypothetical protein